MRSAVTFGTAFLLLAGCAVELWETIPEPVAEALVERRAESLAGWDPAVLDKGTLSSAFVRGTPLMVSRSTEITIDLTVEPESPSDQESGVRTLSFSMDWKAQGGVVFGAAAAVANDGYFLTARHVVEEPPMDLIAIVADEHGDPQVRRSTVRIVWESGDPSGVFDIAVIHADVGLVEAFELWDRTAVMEGPIVTGGWPLPHLKQGSGRSLIAAGRILSVAERGPTGNLPAFSVVQHDAPIIHGDSGAPVLDRQGRLLGVNCKVTYDIPFWDALTVFLGRDPGHIKADDFAGEAIMPDPDWLREVIDRDRRERAGAGEPHIRD